MLRAKEMKQIFSSLLIILFLPIYCYAGCPSSNGDEVGVTGVLKIEIYPGAPNYKSIPRGDKPEKYWFVVSNKSVCFSPDNEFLNEEVALIKIQLILDGFEDQIKESEKYFIQGVTVPAQAGYHHSDVLLRVTSIKAL